MLFKYDIFQEDASLIFAHQHTHLIVCYSGKRGGVDVRSDSMCLCSLSHAQVHMQKSINDADISHCQSSDIFGFDGTLLPIRLIFYILCLSAFLSPLFLSPSRNLLYYLCSAPSAALRSPVSPVEPDDKLRLLLQPTTRNSANAHTHSVYVHMQTHTHLLSHTAEGKVNTELRCTEQQRAE